MELKNSPLCQKCETKEKVTILHIKQIRLGKEYLESREFFRKILQLSIIKGLF